MQLILQENTQGLKIQHYFISQSGTGQPVTEVPNAKCLDVAYVLDNFVFDQNQTYLQICDFDDHLADLTCDWRNPTIVHK